MVTGAVFTEAPERIGSGSVAVPSELYKVILACQGGRYRLIAVMMPNAETGDRSIESLIVPVAEVEKRTGLKFFPDLEVNK